jgi:hypothetical protein
MTVRCGRLAGLLYAALALAGTASAGSFSVITYNVAGLPANLSGSKPDVNMIQISPLLNPYDMAMVQEDFFYHPQLVTHLTHPYQSVLDQSARPPFPFGLGDGLNTFSRSPFTGFQRVTWTDCFGGLEGFGSDCLTPKGITFARHELEPGVWLDVYNLHADAGSDDGSLAARRSNLRQLADLIALLSPDSAVLVLGDFNSRYTRDGDIMPELVADVGLTDVWVEFVRGGDVPEIGPPVDTGCDDDPSGFDCERIDKILYRSSATLLLDPIAYEVPAALFSDAAGDPLSDHDPVTAVFRFSVVPEPGSVALVALGLLGLAARARTRC